MQTLWGTPLKVTNSIISSSGHSLAKHTSTSLIGSAFGFQFLHFLVKSSFIFFSQQSGFYQTTAHSQKQEDFFFTEYFIIFFFFNIHLFQKILGLNGLNSSQCLQALFQTAFFIPIIPPIIYGQLPLLLYQGISTQTLSYLLLCHVLGKCVWEPAG